MRRKTPPNDNVPAAAGARGRALHAGRQMSDAELGARYITRAHVRAVDLGTISPVLKSLAHSTRIPSVGTRDLVARGL